MGVRVMEVQLYYENVSILCIFCQVQSLVGSYFEKYWRNIYNLKFSLFSLG